MKETHSLFITSSGAFMICIILRLEKKNLLVFMLWKFCFYFIYFFFESFAFKKEKIIEGV